VCPSSLADADRYTDPKTNEIEAKGGMLSLREKYQSGHPTLVKARIFVARIP